MTQGLRDQSSKLGHLGGFSASDAEDTPGCLVLSEQEARLVHSLILAQHRGLDSVASGTAGADRMGRVGPQPVLEGVGH